MKDEMDRFGYISMKNTEWLKTLLTKLEVKRGRNIYNVFEQKKFDTLTIQKKCNKIHKKETPLPRRELDSR